MRLPAVAGAFYEAGPAALRAQVEGCFAHRLGPGSLPEVGGGPRRLRALVVPHAGLAFSGPVAAHAYAALARDGLPEAFVVVGPDHAGLGGLVSLSTQHWATPLGPMRQQAALRDALRGGIVLDDDAAHAGEHSVEVQAPFLRWLMERAGKEVPWVPVLMGLQDETTAEELAEALADAIGLAGVDALLVASSDLMHAGPAYRLRAPRGERVEDWCRAQDERALAALRTMEPAKLLDAVRAQDISMCGAGPVAAVMGAAQQLGAQRAEVLAHATSFDVAPRHSGVGYAAAAFL